MENNEKEFDELIELIDEAQKELDKKGINQKDESVTEENTDNNGFIEEEKSNDEQTKIEDHTDADFGFVEDDSNDDVSERCDESNIVGDDNDRNYELLESENDVNDEETKNENTKPWLDEIINNENFVSDKKENQSNDDDFPLLIFDELDKSDEEAGTDEEENEQLTIDDTIGITDVIDEIVSNVVDEFDDESEEEIDDDSEEEIDKNEDSDDNMIQNSDEIFKKYDDAVESTIPDDTNSTVDPDPVVIGRPRPTDELNPELAAMERERRKNQQGSDAEEDIDIPNIFNQPDYSELFSSYNEIIETLDNNINFAIHRIQVANRRFWISLTVAAVAIVLAIIIK